MGISAIILKRSVNLSKTYVILSMFIALMAIGISSVANFIPTTTSATVAMKTFFPILFIAFASLGNILIATPVLLLFVYDKNNGVLEYLLSTGMNQFDLFKSYLMASLSLAGIMLCGELLGYAVLNLYLGIDITLLVFIIILTPVMSLSVVTFTTVIMMAFSSLQKQRVGANQPLGIGLGVIFIFPSILIPEIFPSFAITVVILNVIVIAAISSCIFILSGRLVRREKLLP